MPDNMWGFLTGAKQDKDLGGKGVMKPEIKQDEKPAYKRPRGVSRAEYNASRREGGNVMQEVGKVAKDMTANETLHHGGKHVKLDAYGHPVDASAPTGIDWLLANGPQRESVKAREAAMGGKPTQDKMKTAQQNLGFKQEEIANRHPFERVQDNGQGMKMAFGKDGQPVGFSTQGKSDLHAKATTAGGETWQPSDRDRKESIQNAVKPWQQGLWQTEDARKIQPIAAKPSPVQAPSQSAPAPVAAPPIRQEPVNMKNPTGFLQGTNPYANIKPEPEPFVGPPVPPKPPAPPPPPRDTSNFEFRNPFAIFTDELANPRQVQPTPGQYNPAAQSIAGRNLENPFGAMSRALFSPMATNESFAGSPLHEAIYGGPEGARYLAQLKAEREAQQQADAAAEANRQKFWSQMPTVVKPGY